jgi:hypothetical protein
MCKKKSRRGHGPRAPRLERLAGKALDPCRQGFAEERERSPGPFRLILWNRLPARRMYCHDPSVACREGFWRCGALAIACREGLSRRDAAGTPCREGSVSPDRTLNALPASSGHDRVAYVARRQAIRRIELGAVGCREGFFSVRRGRRRLPARLGWRNGAPKALPARKRRRHPVSATCRRGIRRTIAQRPHLRRQGMNYPERLTPLC